MKTPRFALVALLLVLGGLVVVGLWMGWQPRQKNHARVEEPVSGAGTDSLTRRAVDRLRSIPYLSWQKIEETDSPKDGVTVHDRERAFAGLNLYNVDGESQAHLLDMTGQPVHSWRGPSDGWHHVELGDQGELWVVVQDPLRIVTFPF